MRRLVKGMLVAFGLVLLLGVPAVGGTCDEGSPAPKPGAPPGTDCTATPELCDDVCTGSDPCPAQNSCSNDQDCPNGATCIPSCLPSVCICTATGWVCTDDCAGECEQPASVPMTRPLGMATMAILIAGVLTALVLRNRRRCA